MFDGKKFTLYENDKPIMSWDAVSGAKGYQSPECQYVKKKGTIPEGIYVARQSGLQHYDDYSFVKKLANWKGGPSDWGRHRVWLEPARSTILKGRDGFSIHGGKEFGSAGCIDLEKKIDDFTKWFENNNKDVILHVRY